ncbi:MAG: hypothetical protein KGO96_06835 [Elusimicrobia bacterium]|nr:hypothetical protein [Elusimicrobiota bacterium]
MNETLIRNWNSRVKPEDTIYVIGDVCMGPKEEWPSFTSQLQGKKILVLGNHDIVKPSYLKGRTIERFWQDLGFAEVYEELVIEDGETKLFLKHKPLIGWKEKYPECKLHLCGHVHKAFMYDNVNKIYNVGVDVNGFSPIIIENIKENIDFGNQLKELWI